MYFGNVGNEELQHFHNTIGVDFTMSLSNILTSRLFRVEAITDSIYRVYPLFYCREVISSNANDKILGNKCFILQKKDEDETYLSFITDNAQDNVIIDESVLSVKNIDDKLSTAEFNAFVYMLRNNVGLTGIIDLEDLVFEGVYADYRLNAPKGVLHNDTGFIVNDAIKNNPLTITLTNPFFLNAKYTLTCTVRSLTGANVLNTDNEDYQVTDTFELVLVEDNEVSLDLTGYNNDSVLDFNMDVTVSFDVPEIVNTDFGLTLTSDKTFVPIGTSFNLTATLTGEDNVGGYIVQFFEDNTLIGTETTNNNGLAVLNYIPSVESNHVYTASVMGLSESVNVTVGKYNTSIVLNAIKTIAYIPTTFKVNGVLTNEVGVLSNQNVKLYNNNSLIVTDEPIVTDNNGLFEYTITADAVKNHSIQAVFETTGYNIGSNSNIVSVTARKLNSNITINTNRSTVYYTQDVTISGVLKDELGNPIANAPVTLKYGSSVSDPRNTDSNGVYSFTRSFTDDSYGSTYNYYVVYEGDGSHNTITSSTKPVTYQKAPTSITTDKNSYNVGETIKIRVSSNYGSFNPASVRYYLDNANGVSVLSGTLTTKDSDGNFIITLPNLIGGDYKLQVIYEGNENYTSSVLNKTLTINNPQTLGSITVSKQNNALLLNFKDTNNNNMSNLNISGTEIFISNITSTRSLYDSTADNNGNFTKSFYISSGARVYAKFNNITSNTITW